jgi:hypothetical protein
MKWPIWELLVIQGNSEHGGSLRISAPVGKLFTPRKASTCSVPQACVHGRCQHRAIRRDRRADAPARWRDVGYRPVDQADVGERLQKFPSWRPRRGWYSPARSPRSLRKDKRRWNTFITGPNGANMESLDREHSYVYRGILTTMGR